MGMPYRTMRQLLIEHPKDHYGIFCFPRGSHVAIIAPHGGNIEPRTSEVARAIAGETFNLYCFEGFLPEQESWTLHVTSENYDEPKCKELISNCDFVVAIHGAKDQERRRIYVGGLDEELRDAICEQLKGIRWILMDGAETNLDIVPVLHDGDKYAGRKKSNICNGGKPRGEPPPHGRGVQLELSRTVRNELEHSNATHTNLAQLAQAVRSAIETTAPGSLKSAPPLTSIPPKPPDVLEQPGATPPASQNEQKSTVQDNFSIEEYKALRTEIVSKLEQAREFSRWGLIGLAVLYSYILSNLDKPYLFVAPAVLAWIVVAHLLEEHRMVAKAGDYIRDQIEAWIAGTQGRPKGWGKYLDDTRDLEGPSTWSWSPIPLWYLLARITSALAAIVVIAYLFGYWPFIHTEQSILH